VLKASDTELYSWRGAAAKSLPANVCQSSKKSKTNLLGNECNTTLSYTGSWGGCPLTTPESDRYLQIQVCDYPPPPPPSILGLTPNHRQAVCSPERIETTYASISKSTAVIVSSVLNALAVIAFTIGVYWVAIQQVRPNLSLTFWLTFSLIPSLSSLPLCLCSKEK
jgi:hypothetical protein